MLLISISLQYYWLLLCFESAAVVELLQRLLEVWGGLQGTSLKTRWTTVAGMVWNAAQTSSNTLCRFTLWLLWFRRAPLLCNTRWLITVQMTLYKLINSMAWLFIIGLEVHSAMHWTRAKINDWKTLYVCNFALLLLGFRSSSRFPSRARVI